LSSTARLREEPDRLQLLVFDFVCRIDFTDKFLYTRTRYDSKTYMHSRSISQADHAVAYNSLGDSKLYNSLRDSEAFALVEVVTLGTERPTLSSGSTSLASCPVTRQVYAAGGLPAHEKTRTQQKSSIYKSRTLQLFDILLKYIFMQLHIFLFFNRCMGAGRPRYAATPTSSTGPYPDSTLGGCTIDTNSCLQRKTRVEQLLG
jgi:hypothetical protein